MLLFSCAKFASSKCWLPNPYKNGSFGEKFKSIGPALRETAWILKAKTEAALHGQNLLFTEAPTLLLTDCIKPI